MRIKLHNMKNIKKISMLAALLFVLFAAKSQTLYFCEGVDDDGYPENSSHTFTIPYDGGYFYFLVSMGNKVRTTHVEYDIYKVNDYGDEKYNTTISQDVEYDWTYFWKKVTFYDAGTYKVYAYDDDDYLLCSGTVEVHY